MTTEYQIRLDREACEGVFACLVRDDRFVEASDGLAAVEASDGLAAVEASDRLAAVEASDELPAGDGGRRGGDGTDLAAGGAAESDELRVSFADERLDDARQAARACPVDAIEVLTRAQTTEDADE